MSFKSFLPKLRKQFARKVLRLRSILDISGDGHKEKPLHCLLKASILSYFITIIIIIIVIKQVLQVIPVKVNYNYFTVHKASSLNL